MSCPCQPHAHVSLLFTRVCGRYVVDTTRATEGPVAVFRMQARVTTLSYIAIRRGVNAGGSQPVTTGAGGEAGAGAGAGDETGDGETQSIARRGCVGFLVGGDESGRVYLLRVYDLGSYLQSSLMRSDSFEALIPKASASSAFTGTCALCCTLLSICVHSTPRTTRVLVACSDGIVVALESRWCTFRSSIRGPGDACGWNGSTGTSAATATTTHALCTGVTLVVPCAPSCVDLPEA